MQANLDEQQTSSNVFVRALMTCVCQSAVICEQIATFFLLQAACRSAQAEDVFPTAGENPYKVDSEWIKQRAKLLQRYLRDEQKELQALYALQALMVQMEQPASKHLKYPPPLLLGAKYHLL